LDPAGHRDNDEHALFYIDGTATNSAMRFYRAVSETGGNTNVTPTNLITILSDSISADYPQRHE
jgi:hypothetical protein